MKNELNPRDIEQISAYLDAELNPKDKMRLERRLKVEPELRRELHELGETRSMLRSLPRQHAPRNFTLSPAMVGARRKKDFDFFRLTPALSLSSVLATLLLALVLLGDYLTGGLRPVTQVAEAPSVQSLAVTESVSENYAQIPESEAARVAESGPADLPGTPAPDVLQKATTTEEAATMMGGVPDEALTEPPGVIALAPPSFDATPTLSAPEMTQQSAAQTAAPPGMGVGPEIESPDMAGAAESAAAVAEEQTADASPTPPGRLIWLVLEVSLASLAVLSALAFFILRWKARV